MTTEESFENNSPREILVDWLNCAYGTEQQQIKILENHIQEAADHPRMQFRLRSHLAQTQKHTQMLERCLEQLGGSASTVKIAMGKMSEAFTHIGGGMFEDELVKNCLADYSLEHFEIATYKGLIAGAEVIGEHDIADTCRQILRDEEDMAAWLERNLGTVVQECIEDKTSLP